MFPVYCVELKISTKKGYTFGGYSPQVQIVMLVVVGA